MNKLKRVSVAVMAALMVTVCSAPAAFAFSNENAAETVNPMATASADDGTNGAGLIAGTSTGSALTPDGNLKLVDDKSKVSSNDKQFITVETKSGNTFYRSGPG